METITWNLRNYKEAIEVSKFVLNNMETF